MEDPHSTLEKLNDKGDGIRVDFYWLGDRFGHTLSVVKEGEASIVWRSIEDDEQCPAFQELHEQTDSRGNKMLFLHGASNSAQWSASVTLDDRKFIPEFDVAARVTAGSLERWIQYQGNFAEKPPIFFGYGVGDCKVQESDQLICFIPESEDAILPATLRWKYAFFLA